MHEPDSAYATPASPSSSTVGRLPTDGPSIDAHPEADQNAGPTALPPLDLPASWLAQRRDAPVRTGPARARPDVWLRRTLWFALIWLCVLLPVVQWGSGADTLYAAAAAARDAWRYDRALDDYARLAQRDPFDPRPHCLTGQVLALQQRFAEAQAAYATCERLGDNSASTWLAQGDAARSGGDLGAAERAWLRAVAAGSRMAHRRLALLYEQQGRLSDAASEWRSLGAQDGQAQEHVGLLALAAGDYSTARGAFVNARALPGEFGQDAADGGFVAFAALPPQDAEGFATLGGEYVQDDLLPLARQPVEQAIALDPSNGLAHAYLAWVLLGTGQRAAGAAEATAATRLAPANSFAWFAASEAAMEDGRWSAAVSDLQKSIPHDSKDPVLWAALGRAYTGERDYIHAAASLSTAAELGTDSIFTVQLLRFYVTHGVGAALGAGTQAATSALDRYPQDAEVALLAGQIYGMSSDVDQSYGAMQHANQLDPSLPEPYFYLGQFAVNEQNYDQAALDLSTYVALRPNGDLAAQARALLVPLAVFDL